MPIRHQNKYPEIIGLIPAAGQATRISPLPSSKELYPIGFQQLDNGKIRPKVVCHYLLERMRLAGIRKAYFLLRSGKWDIPSYFGDGAMLDMNIGYLMVRLLYGVPFTLDQAYPFVQNSRIALGFPDILFHPKDAFKRLIARQTATDADIVLGLVPFPNPQKGGMVDFDATGRVSLVIEKPAQSDLRYSWCVAVWTPVFTEFLHQYVTNLKADYLGNNSDRNQGQREKPIGDVIQAAIESGLDVRAEVMNDGSYLDIGTPEDLVKAVSHFAQPGNFSVSEKSQNMRSAQASPTEVRGQNGSTHRGMEYKIS